MRFLLPLLVVCAVDMLLLAVVHGAPFNSYDTMLEEMVMPESRVLDFDNLTESERTDLLRNQINITAVKLQQQRLREAAQKNGQRAGAPMAIKLSASEPNVSSHTQNRKAIEKHIIGNIKQSIESNLMRNDSYAHVVATHEMAFSAVCEMPKHTNQSFWDDDYTWNLFFRLLNIKPYTTVNSAILRLYMNGGVNLTAEDANRRETTENCKDPSDQMLRVTVSVYWRKKGKDNSSTERKKRICSSINITRNYRGWITLDTLLAVKLWDKPNRNLGIAIDVQDQEDNPLPAYRFFQPTDCSEASKANATSAVLPWSFFRNSLSWTSDEMDDVPHVPRIDVMMHKTLPQQHPFFPPRHHHHHHSQQHHHRGIFRSKPQHYGGVRYRLESASSSSSSSSASAANSYESSLDEVEIKQHPSVHARHSLTKPHKKRHLNHGPIQRSQFESNSAESDEDYSASASLEERKL